MQTMISTTKQQYMLDVNPVTFEHKLRLWPRILVLDLCTATQALSFSVVHSFNVCVLLTGYKPIVFIELQINWFEQHQNSHDRASAQLRRRKISARVLGSCSVGGMGGSKQRCLYARLSFLSLFYGTPAPSSESQLL